MQEQTLILKRAGKDFTDARRTYILDTQKKTSNALQTLTLVLCRLGNFLDIKIYTFKTTLLSLKELTVQSKGNYNNEYEYTGLKFQI